MSNLLMNDTFVWSVLGVAVVLFAWLWWPKKSVTETLAEVKVAEAASAPVEPQITDAVTTNSAKKPRAKKPATPKVASKKAPAKKVAPKKAVKKGKK